MKIAFVDDEQKCLDEINRLCNSFGESTGYSFETVSFCSGEAFLASFAAGGFDLVFMDIYMEGMDGITAGLKMRRQDKSCLLVFLTSSTDFMPDAFSCHAFEYVTKPFSKERIFEVLQEALEALPQGRKFIEVSAGRQSVCVFLDELVSAVTDAHYLDITLADGKGLRCRMTMAQFIEKAGRDARLILVNKGIAVNAEHILKFEKGCCIMKNGARFPVRVRDSAKVQQMAMDYHFGQMRQGQAGFAGRRHGKGI